jgi:mRNA interferase RelE/StbE
MTERKRYALELSSSAEKALERLPKNVVVRIDKAINSLADDPRPRGYKKLVGTENDYRIRVGDYRIIYSIEDDKLIVLVVDVGHRKDIYRG